VPGLIDGVLVANQVLFNPVNAGFAILRELYKIQVAVSANANHLCDPVAFLYGQSGLPLLVVLTIVVRYE
jgi:hypothetical protein